MNTILRKSIIAIKSYPLSLTAMVAISIATFMNPISPINIAKFDKLMHFIAYTVTCCVFWYEYYRTRDNKQSDYLYIYAVIVPIILSGTLELLQGIFTKERQCDILDFLFNCLGILFALFLSIVIKKCRHQSRQHL